MTGMEEEIEGRRFTFPPGWRILKYDDSAFHRRQFQSFAGGSKAADAVAIAADRTLWVIEVKDYRQSRRSKPGTVFAEVAAKVRATLAGLATARIRANDDAERNFADLAMRGNNIRIVLHLDQPRHTSRLFPHVVDPRTATQALQKEVRAVDPHAICYGCGVGPHNLPWTVQCIEEHKA